MGQFPNLAAVGGKSVWELVVAMQARQLFDDVDLAFDVEAPAGNMDQIPLLAPRQHRETETCEDAADLNRAEFLAENSLHFPQIELHRGQVKLAGNHVDHFADERATTGAENQLGDPVSRSDGRFEIGAALKPVRGVGVNAVPLRHTAHRDRVPPRGFDQDVVRFLRDHRVEAAHHAGQSHRLFRVGNDEIFGGKLVLHAIQSLERFAGSGFANHQAAFFEQIEIEHVRGLANLPQDVVGSVHRVADGALINQLQTAGNVRGRGLDGNSANFARCEARTQLRLLNVDGDVGFTL